MTEIEARAKSADKVKQITELAEKLQVVINAKQCIVGNEIKNVVYFTDHEEYDIEKKAPSVLRGPASEGMGSHISELKKDENSDIL